MYPIAGADHRPLGRAAFRRQLGRCYLEIGRAQKLRDLVPVEIRIFETQGEPAAIAVVG
jgi:hypothetical protein